MELIPIPLVNERLNECGQFLNIASHLKKIIITLQFHAINLINRFTFIIKNVPVLAVKTTITDTAQDACVPTGLKDRGISFVFGFVLQK